MIQRIGSALTIAVLASALVTEPRAHVVRLDPHEDCQPYDASAVRVEPYLDRTWVLTDGRSQVASFENQLDAANGLAVALGHAAYCFVGRRADRPPGVDVIEYLQGTSSITRPIAPESCIQYLPLALNAERNRENGWRVTDRARFNLRVTDAGDAALLISVARQFSAYCTIGYAPRRAFPHNEQPLHYWR